MGTGGFSKSRLARMHDVMAGYVERGEVPGLVTLLCRRGEVHVDPIGALAAGGTPVRRDSIFRIASMTKPVTAVAAMILVEECRLRLDDPVDALLPELADRRVLTSLASPLDDTVPAERPITLRDLLTFTMGFGQLAVSTDTYPFLAAADGLQIGIGPPDPAASPPTPDEWLRRLGTLPLVHQPGEAWMYNTGSDVVGVLIERATGQAFGSFLSERVLEPLGMVDTSFCVPADKVDRLATAYTSLDPATGERTTYDEAAGGAWTRRPSFPSGAGGLVSTVDDYLAFGLMMLNRGRHGGGRLLSRPGVEVMTTDHLRPDQRAHTAPFLAASRGWGFGVSVVTARSDLAGSVGTFGWDGGLGTTGYVDPREEMVLVLMTQQAWTSPAGPTVLHDFWTSAYQAIDD
jgi:CubicO group peptidase (beta-lactamase class C family)